MINIADQLHAATEQGIVASAGEILDPAFGSRQTAVNMSVQTALYGAIVFDNTDTGEENIKAVRFAAGDADDYLCFITSAGVRYYSTSMEAGAYVYYPNSGAAGYSQVGVVLEKVAPTAGGGGDFNPEGTYPNLTAGGLLGKDGDAVIDQTTGKVFRSAGGDESISDGNAKISLIKGALEHVSGVSVPFTATKFRSIGYNAFNPEHVLEGKKIENGSIVAASGWNIAFVHVLQGVANGNNGYVVNFGGSFHTDEITVGYCAGDPTAATSCTALTAQTITSLPCYLPSADGYLLISTQRSLSDLCVHLKWSYGQTQEKYEAYWDSIIPLPRTHSWGTGRVNNIYDEINFGEQTLTIAVDRVKLSELHFERVVTEHEADSTHDEEYNTYSYICEDLVDAIKASTTNIDYYGVSGCTIQVTSESKLLIEAGETELDLPAIFGNIYLYYEKAAVVYRDLSLADYYDGSVSEIVVYYDVSDFGTEEYLDTVVAPSQAAYLYLPNMVDSLRALMFQDRTDRTATIDFGQVREVVSKRNMLDDITINSIKCDNVSWVKIYLNGTLSLHLTGVTDGTEMLTDSLAVAEGAKMTFEIARATELQDAQVNYSYSY